MLPSQIRGLRRKGIMAKLVEQGVQVKSPEMTFRAFINSYYAKKKRTKYMCTWDYSLRKAAYP